MQRDIVNILAVNIYLNVFISLSFSEYFGIHIFCSLLCLPQISIIWWHTTFQRIWLFTFDRCLPFWSNSYGKTSLKVKVKGCLKYYLKSKSGSISKTENDKKLVITPLISTMLSCLSNIYKTWARDGIGCSKGSCLCSWWSIAWLLGEPTYNFA